MSDEETLSAATAIVRDLARNVAPSYNPPAFNLPTKQAANGRVSLRGRSCNSKLILELELSALASRIQYLEDKADIVNHQSLPDTPNELGAPTSPFANGTAATSRNGSKAEPVRKLSGSSRHARITHMLAGTAALITEDDLVQLREHVEKQSEEIQDHKKTMGEFREELSEQQHDMKRTFVKVETEDIGTLERELLKHQQANEAFQKALKEIGTIITNVANGDLSQKVQIHAIEMDPEITTFKRTINTMMDQLQVFGNEVSRVAREVGTEGKLGGQAQITGVSGIWKDLTFNGKLCSSAESWLGDHC